MSGASWRPPRRNSPTSKGYALDGICTVVHAVVMVEVIATDESADW